MTTGRDQHSVADTNSLTTTKYISNKEPDPYESWQSCYGTSTDLKEMLTHFWLYIQRFIHDTTDHTHSIQWDHWINHDKLTVDTDLMRLNCILGITTMDQLYIMLRDSPAINAHYDLAWNHKIC
jgi:hypothetical protein